MAREDLMVPRILGIGCYSEIALLVQYGIYVILPYLVYTKESLDSLEGSNESGLVSIPVLKIPLLHFPPGDEFSVPCVMAGVVTSYHEPKEQEPALQSMVESLYYVPVKR